MRSQHERLARKREGHGSGELQLLSEIQRAPQTTQRNLARRAGIALGLTNLLLRNLTRKGQVRITRAGWRSWLYTVTPAGFSRKIHLTKVYIHRVIGDYRMVREILREELGSFGLNAESRVAVYGTSEFAELVFLGLKETGIQEVDVFVPGTSDGGGFLGVSVRDLAMLRSENYDRVVVTSLEDTMSACVVLRDAGVPDWKLVTFFVSADGNVKASQEAI